MRFQIQGTVAMADLHGVYQQDAKDLLSGWLNTAPAAVTELRVIHGYQRGTAPGTCCAAAFPTQG